MTILAKEYRSFNLTGSALSLLDVKLPRNQVISQDVEYLVTC